jgi:hypothetical protein
MAFSKVLPWSKLNTISKSRTVRASVLIPLIGLLIIFNDKLAEYLKLNGELYAIQQSTISPRLMLIYFGLCAIAAGVTAFSMLCPDEVRHYGSANSYITGDGPNIKDFAFEEIEEKLRNSSMDKEYVRIRDRYEGRGRALTETERTKVNNDILHLYFKFLNEGKAARRGLVWLFYAIGLYCLVIPSLGVFLRVANKLWPIARDRFDQLF